MVVNKDCFSIPMSEDEIAVWDRLTGAPSPGSFPARPSFWVNELFVWPESLKGKRVMELGCGLGHWGREVAKYAEAYIGIDVSRYCIHKARATHAAWPNMEFFHTVDDARELLGMGWEFDGVFGVSFFIHQTNARFGCIMRFAYNMLCAGGWLSVDYVTGDYGLRDDHPSKGKDWRTFNRTKAELEAMLSSCGFGEFVHHISGNPRYTVKGVPLRGYLIARKVEAKNET